ncbi:villin-1-like isoform X1 [Bolinopsis microptera]|uniref:villin-1-like isoform X1 n=2 Tax=Bolinopsis microptera TaxID=2820187 RepID=UPI00307A9932
MPVVQDPVLREAGIKAGIMIWRVENLQLAPAQQEAYGGVFYKGDSYLILKTVKQPRTKYDIHFWLGSQTSNDEAGIAAIKAVELDDMLGGAPVQHREVQGNESANFRAYFKTLRYKDGGVGSGFKKVTDVFKNRLYQVKGRRRVRVTEVPCLIDSVNSGDVFILDTKQIVYLFYGSESNKIERQKGIEVANQIRDVEHQGTSQVFVLDQNDKTVLRAEGRKFFTVLGANPEYINHIKSATEGGQDSLVAQSTFMNLIRVSDASGRMLMELAGRAPLNQDMLVDQDSYILDHGGNKIFVWHGKGSTREERKSSMIYASEYMIEKGYPADTMVTSCYQYAEPVEFRQCFLGIWKERVFANHETGPEKRRAAPTVTVNSLHKRRERSEAKRMFDDGTGEKQVWRIEKMKPVAVPAGKIGQFYSGDCYIVFYSYRENAGHGKEVQIVYYWIGAHSTPDERGAAAAFAVELDDKHGGKPIQMRIVQGKEPPHFMLIFKGTLIIRQGGNKSAFTHVKKREHVENGENGENGVNGSATEEPMEEDLAAEQDESTSNLFHVKGSTEDCCKGIEVVPKASMLNSNDVFVLSYDITTYVWYGKGCSSMEMKVGDYIATTIVNKSAPMLGIHEGAEPAQFWTLLGGKEEYADSVTLATAEPIYPARLFHVSNAKGYIAIEEIADFAQEDLIEEDVIILDCSDEVFVWIGAGANEDERSHGLELATEYITSDPTGRDPDAVTIYQIRQGHEPPNFRAHFAGWDFRFRTSKIKISAEDGVTLASDALAQLERDNYPYSELIDGKCPVGVDPCSKENYLGDEEFMMLFGMDRAKFLDLPKWKKLSLKKEKKLF